MAAASFSEWDLSGQGDESDVGIGRDVVSSQHSVQNFLILICDHVFVEGCVNLKVPKELRNSHPDAALQAQLKSDGRDECCNTSRRVLGSVCFPWI